LEKEQDERKAKEDERKAKLEIEKRER